MSHDIRRGACFRIDVLGSSCCQRLRCRRTRSASSRERKAKFVRFRMPSNTMLGLDSWTGCGILVKSRTTSDDYDEYFWAYTPSRALHARTVKHRQKHGELRTNRGRKIPCRWFIHIQEHSTVFRLSVYEFGTPLVVAHTLRLESMISEWHSFQLRLAEVRATSRCLL